MSSELTVDVNSMPRIVFVGDSQTCGCVGAWDYPQMLSWELPLRVFNRAVGGSNTSHLLQEKSGGTVTVKAGDKHVSGEQTSWFAGPYLGMTVRFGTQRYTLDHIHTTDYAKRNCDLYLTEPAREDYAGTDYAFEPGWRVRVEEVKPQYACFMYSVNDPGWSSEQYQGFLAEITRRCREQGIQPIFLSGVPLMDAAAGGSHPGGNDRVLPRPRDMEEFCRAEKLPFGDVFRTLLKLDGQHTAEWVDTVHPTTDGSLPALWALRHILTKLGVAANPYYLRGYRAAGETLPDLRGGRPAPSVLEPISTAQPRYNAKKQMDETGFDLEARRLNDEYGLLAEADGQVLRSDRPLVLELGCGEAAALQGAELRLVTTGRVQASLFDCPSGTWQALGEGSGRCALALSAEQLRRGGPAGGAAGAVWIALRGESLGLDYAGLVLRGAVKPFAPQAAAEPIVWPAADEFAWSEEGNLLPNGALTEAREGLPAGWRATGAGCGYVGNAVVARGHGEFSGERRLDGLHSGGQQFRSTVRPLDLVQVAAGPEGCTGNFLVSAVTDHERLALRRVAKEPAAVDFTVLRFSGCGAVPGGCALEAGGPAAWEATTPALPAGRYELGYYCRVFDPHAMGAKSRPGAVAKVSVLDRVGKILAESTVPDCTYLWQRARLRVDVTAAGALTVRLSAAPGATVQYTGITLKAAGE